MKFYLDVCCLNRPFDDQEQERIRLEAEAVLLIMARAKGSEWQWVSSEVVEDEIRQTLDLKRHERLQNLILHAQETILLSESQIERAKDLRKLGFGDMDALHLACAEGGNVDIFLTTDDKLVNRATRLANQLNVMVYNPLNWLTIQEESEGK